MFQLSPLVISSRDPSSQNTWARNDRWILPENALLPHNIQGSFTGRKSTTWDRRLYFPSEGRRTEDFFPPWKIQRLRSALNPRTWVPKASRLPLDHRSRHVLVLHNSHVFVSLQLSALSDSEYCFSYQEKIGLNHIDIVQFFRDILSFYWYELAYTGIYYANFHV